MSSTWKPFSSEHNRIVVAVYADEEMANRAVTRLSQQDCPMDQISVLGRVNSTGDDPLGIYHLNLGERVQAWGMQGAFWGGLWGMLAGAAGFFIIPGIGPLAAAGYIVEALVAGAVVGVGAMAGAAAASQLAVAFHRAGIPEESIQSLHKAIEEGKYLLLLRGAESEAAEWREALEVGNPSKVYDFPYVRVIDHA